ncbi:MAG TPA: ABC transporter ATP-binding protein [Methylomirabilota bacterium]|nr:ABC transporter ATP-binding protein [Methylomirabilota bacterium]
MVEIRDLVRQYGALEAVRGLSLSIQGGEIFGLLGPNGAGKSTTLKILATLLKPTSGTVRLLNLDVVSQANDVRRIIGYVPEGAELYEALSGAEFLNLVADLHRLSSEQVAGSRTPLAEAFSITPDLDRPISGYSKGMKQKILLIAALQHDPEVLLLDEPLDGLDVAAQEHLKKILRRYSAAGKTVIYSSHILEVVERLCDRVGIIHQGKLVALGPPAQLIAQNGHGSFSDLFLELTGSSAP